PGAIQPPMYQQPPPYMAPPVMPQKPVPPTPPPGYTPPGGYRPPALARPSLKPTSTQKTPTTASKTKTSTTKKPSTYRPPSTKTPSKSSGSSIETKVARLENNDFRQDIRLGNLERNVGLLPDSIEGGGVASMAPIGNHYIVRPGDTLLGIASRHGTSTNVLRSLNHMDDDVVDIGQSLLIPSPGSSSYSGGSFTGVHVVKSGDTFTQIARDHGLSTDALARANKTVYPDRLLIGERLVVPGGRSSSHSGSFDTGMSFISTKSKSSTHTVKKGEHLGSIAKKHGISTSALAKANRLKNANIIEIGDRLIIPGRSSGGMSQQLAFTEQDAEPLADFRIPEPPTPPVKPEPIAPLPPINGSTPALTTITNSSSTPRGVVAYRMERGDTLDTVANMFSTTTENIRALNKFPADKVLKEGNELFVPSVGAVSVN
ncbi:MAG: LysM peptidoglycan-binding domain-containing protein, partial [Verrucomicrobia bacterium]|nr:LysM peptidoglycan-binding domain-containing protein [Verrucomicrobiota bacterium]